MGAAQDLQVAIKTALRGDSALVALINGTEHVKDWPNPDGPFPLITIGEDAERQWPNKNESNYQTDAVIHIWSRKRGWQQANQILDRMDVVFLENTITMPGSSTFSILGKAQRPQPIRKLPGDDEGRIRHIVTTYKFWISC